MFETTKPSQSAFAPGIRPVRDGDSASDGSCRMMGWSELAARIDRVWSRLSAYPISPTSGRVLYVPLKDVNAKTGEITFADGKASCLEYLGSKLSCTSLIPSGEPRVM